MNHANILPGAQVSPRIANGCLCWYEGDTFQIDLEMSLEDQDGEKVEMAGGDSVAFTFYDKTRNKVHECTFTGVQQNTVTLNVTQVVSAKFPKGLYTYDVVYTHGDRTTLARDNRIRVE